MWNYCTLGKSALVLFAFDLYDADSSGAIEPDEVSRMLKDVYGKNFGKSKLAKKIYNKLVNSAQAELELDQEVNIPQFEKFCKTHPALLYPAYVFQTEMQHRCLGEGFWKKKARHRIHLSGGHYTNAIDFLKAQVNANAFKSLIVEPFDNKNRSANFATNDERSALNDVMEVTGSVAARRANRSFRTAATVTVAASKFKHKKGRGADSYMADRERQKTLVDKRADAPVGSNANRKRSGERKTSGDRSEAGVRKSLKKKRAQLQRGQSNRPSSTPADGKNNMPSMRRAQSERQTRKSRRVVPT
jgi:hypothetical protein